MLWICKLWVLLFCCVQLLFVTCSQYENSLLQMWKLWKYFVFHGQFVILSERTPNRIRRHTKECFLTACSASLKCFMLDWSSTMCLSTIQSRTWITFAAMSSSRSELHIRGVLSRGSRVWFILTEIALISSGHCFRYEDVQRDRYISSFTAMTRIIADR